MLKHEAGSERVAPRHRARNFDVLAEGFDAHQYNLVRRGKQSGRHSKSVKHKSKKAIHTYSDCPVCDQQNKLSCDQFYGDQCCYFQYLRGGRVFFRCSRCGAMGVMPVLQYVAPEVVEPEDLA